MRQDATFPLSSAARAVAKGPSCSSRGSVSYSTADTIDLKAKTHFHIIFYSLNSRFKILKNVRVMSKNWNNSSLPCEKESICKPPLL